LLLSDAMQLALHNLRVLFCIYSPLRLFGLLRVLVLLAHIPGFLEHLLSRLSLTLPLGSFFECLAQLLLRSRDHRPPNLLDEFLHPASVNRGPRRCHIREKERVIVTCGTAA